ncbi:hypothetical protein LPJ64_004733 [Coemansia asiatica]|uniref:Secreted protein n=1 Tax=Coemansia asiatica TaxID=1052880 RepID=A0A9W7XII3_9FUNG|nr:hypothetical protein LPJ64_004733 [Coemansia asiatica]
MDRRLHLIVLLRLSPRCMLLRAASNMLRDIHRGINRDIRRDTHRGINSTSRQDINSSRTIHNKATANNNSTVSSSKAMASHPIPTLVIRHVPKDIPRKTRAILSSSTKAPSSTKATSSSSSNRIMDP